VENVMGKVRALLALTASSNIDEARNAALAMARLIQGHHLVISMPAEGHGTTFPRPSRKSTVVNGAVVEAWVAQQETLKKARDAAIRTGRPVKTTQQRTEKDVKPMKAKYAGVCTKCKKPIKPNTHIYWSPDHGAYHPLCFIQAE
jgi:hypothetical protein